MRPLTDDETTTFFEKLAQYIGRNIKQLIDRPDEPHCFRLHKERVYYVSERVMRQATSIARDDLVALGTCFGKFTKTKKFHLKISALDHLAQYAKVRARARRAWASCPRPWVHPGGRPWVWVSVRPGSDSAVHTPAASKEQWRALTAAALQAQATALALTLQ